MASPRLESLCCINISDTKDDFMLGTKVYNITCIVSSSLSILGAVYTLLPRKVPENARRRTSIGQDRQRKIIDWLAVADFLACIGILVRSSVWLGRYDYFKKIPITAHGESFDRIFCALSGAWIQYFYITTYFWTLCFAVDVLLLMRNRTSEMWLYHVLSWLISAVLCVDGLISLYFPSLSSCERRIVNLVPHYLATLAPMLMVMICNPILYFFSARNVSSLIKARFGRFTDQERAVIKQVKEKFALILAVFYVCWLPNVINAVLLFFNSRYKDNSSIEAGIIVMDVMMGILNPLQAFLNALVYRGWAGCCNIKRPFSRTLNEDERPGLMESTSQLLDSGRVKETSPLLLNNEN